VTLRGVDWAVVLAGSVVGAAILGGCAAFGADGPSLRFVRLALITLVGAAAFVLDEPAGAAVDAVPTTRLRRTAVRSSVVALPLAMWTAGVLSLEKRNAVTEAGALLVEGAGVLAFAVALAAFLRLAGRNEPGEVVASALGAALLAVLIIDPSMRSVQLFPADEGWGASSALWGSVAAVAVVIVIVASRDPYRRWSVKTNR
jgi:hypothetical protein